jgi:hypothetical protein
MRKPMLHQHGDSADAGIECLAKRRLDCVEIQRMHDIAVRSNELVDLDDAVVCHLSIPIQPSTSTR